MTTSGPVLRLDDFGLTDLEVHWRHAGAAAGAERDTLGVGYQVEEMVGDPTRFRLTLTVDDRTRLAADQPPAIVKATAVGFFSLPESTPPAERARVIRVNGLTVLYGALRGALAAVTGLFPPDCRYVLPTVNMLEVIQHVEGGNREERKEPAPVSKGRRGSGRPRKVAD